MKLKLVGIFTAAVLVFSGLTAQPALADEPTNTVPETLATVSNVKLSVEDDAGNPANSVITADFNTTLESAGTTAVLYKTGSSTPVTEATQGGPVQFTVPKPASGYDRYNVIVGGSITSNTVTVSSVTSVWNVSLSTDMASFGVANPKPTLTWNSNVDLSTQPGHVLLVVDTTTNSVVYFSQPEDTTTGSISLNDWLWDYSPHEYEVRIQTDSIVETVSNSIKITPKPWNIEISVDKTEVANGESATLTWSTNQPFEGWDNPNAQYALHIYEISNGVRGNRILETIGSSTSGTVSVSPTAANPTKTYQAVVMKRKSYWFTEEVAVSNLLSITSSAWTIDLATSHEVYSTDETPVLTWTANQNILRNGNYKVVTVNETDPQNAFVYSTYYPASWSNAQPTKTGSDYLTPRFNTGSLTFRAYVIPASVNATLVKDFTDVQAISSSVTITRSSWEISIQAASSFVVDGYGRPGIAWQTNQSIKRFDHEAYRIYVVDESTPDNKVVAAVVTGDDNSGTSGGTWWEPFLTGAGHTYRAYVAEYSWDPLRNYPKTLSELTGIQASSNSVLIERAPWEAHMAVSQSFDMSGSTYIVLDWELNQQINATQGYAFYFVNETTGDVTQRDAYTWWDQNAYVGDIGPLVYNPGDAYRGYVARRNTENTPQKVNQLEDIQAITDLVLPDQFSGPSSEELRGGSNPSQSNCNQQCHGDPINSATGEFYENETDLTLPAAVPFSFQRSYSTANSDKNNSGLGYGWTHNFNMSIASTNDVDLDEANSVKVTQENSSTINFYRSGGQFVSQGRVLAELRHDSDNGVYILDRKGDIELYFDDETGKLVKVQDRNGRYLNLSYANGKLATITADDGKTLTLNWSSGNITSIVDYAGRSVTYTYNTSSELTEVQHFETDEPSQYTYNGSHQVLTMIAPNGGVTTNEYDAEGRVTKQVDPLGGNLTFSYSNTTTTITKPDGMVDKEEYNNRYQLQVQYYNYGTDKQLQVEYFYDANNQTIAERVNGSETTSYTYDANGNKLTITDPKLHVTTFTYNEHNQLLTTTNALQKTSAKTYDSNGNVTSQTSFGGAVTEYTYDAQGVLQSTRNPREVANNSSAQTTYTYDSNGFMNSTTTPEGVITTMVNNSLGNPVSVSDEENNTTTYFYDAHQRLIKVGHPNGATEETTYNSVGQVISEEDVKGNVATYTYDIAGQPLTVTTPAGTTTNTYDSLGRLTHVEDSTGRTLEYGYDNVGNVISVTDPEGNSASSVYNNKGQVVQSTDSEGKTSVSTYDILGNLISSTDPLGNATQYEYDELNRVKTVTDAENKTISYLYTDDSQVNQVTQTDGSIKQYQYDANGNVTKKIFEDLTFETYGYDNDNRVTAYHDRANRTTAYQHNNIGQVNQVIRPDNSTISYSYNETGQPYQTSYDSWTTVDATYTYNTAGELLSTVTDDSTITYQYDVLGNLTYRGPPNTGGVSYEYDDAYNLEKLIYPSGDETSYSYDLNSNLKTVKFNDKTVAQYDYNKNNAPTQVIYGNDLSEARSYKANGWLDTLQYGTESVNELYKKQFTYNRIGLETSVTEKLNNTTVTTGNSYDDRYRLNTVTEGPTPKAYAFDSVTNLTETPTSTLTYNNIGQLQTKTETAAPQKVSSYQYDALGNRTSETLTNSATTVPTVASTTYQWDEKNQLINVTLPDSATVDYGYDASGLLKERTVTDGTSVDEEEFVWDVNSSVPVMLEDGDNVYVYGASSTPIMQVDKTTDDVLYLYGDDRHSVVFTTDDRGNQVSSYKYDEYGNVTAETGDTNHDLTNFAYAGEYLDSETGNYYLRARWYEPTTGSFLSMDPASASTGENYSYGSGNPLRYSDPLGLWSMDDTMFAFVGVMDGVSGGIYSGMVGLQAPGFNPECSTTYLWANGISTAASFIVPAPNLIRSVGMTAKLISFGLDSTVSGQRIVGLLTKAASATKTKFSQIAKNVAEHREAGSTLIPGAVVNGAVNAAKKAIAASNRSRGNAYASKVAQDLNGVEQVYYKTSLGERRFVDVQTEKHLGGGKVEYTIYEVKYYKTSIRATRGIIKQMDKDLAIKNSQNNDVKRVVWYLHPDTLANAHPSFLAAIAARPDIELWKGKRF